MRCEHAVANVAPGISRSARVHSHGAARRPALGAPVPFPTEVLPPGAARERTGCCHPGTAAVGSGRSAGGVTTVCRYSAALSKRFLNDAMDILWPGVARAHSAESCAARMDIGAYGIRASLPGHGPDCGWAVCCPCNN